MHIATTLLLTHIFGRRHVLDVIELPKACHAGRTHASLLELLSRRRAVAGLEHKRSPEVEIEPSEVGFDPVRLSRIDRHFQRYVDDGRLPGWQLLISRGGKVVHHSVYGRRDKEADLPVEVDTLFRIYSMTKPITSVAAMMLYEEGAFGLTTPVCRFIPSFEQVRVSRRGPYQKPMTSAVKEPVRMWHLLTHTAGLTYGVHRANVVDESYRAAGYDL